MADDGEESSDGKAKKRRGRKQGHGDGEGGKGEVDDSNPAPHRCGTARGEHRFLVAPLLGMTREDIQEMISMRLPTSRSTSRALSNCARVCVAVMMVRMRALPSGTVGKAMPVPKTPSLNSSREKSMVRRPSPMMMGVMGVSLCGVFCPPMLKPSPPNSFFQ